MKIRNRSMSGAVFGVWVSPGDVIEVADDEGRRYVDLGYAEEVADRRKPAENPEPRVEYAVASAPETAALTTENVETPVKRGPGRPSKAASS